MKRPGILFLLFCTSHLVCAQLDNQVFEDRLRINKADSGRLFLGLNTLGFAKNNEYTNNIVDGATLFGYQFSPHLSYRPSGDIRLDAGIFLKKDFGADDFTDVEPLFSFAWKPGDFSLIFGNLESSLNHRLIEPLYDFERVMNDRLENGLQLQWIKEGLFLDLWVDWENAIFRGDEEQEEITGGLSLDYRVFNNDRVSVGIPLQVLIYHLGGQINLNTDPVVTLVNSAFGANFEYRFPKSNFIRSWRMDHYYVLYGDPSSQTQQAFEEGGGFYFNFLLNTRFNLGAMVSYWNAKEFIAPRGGPLYQSVSNKVGDPLGVEEDREILLLRFLYDLKIADGVYLTARFEPFYDLRNATFEHSIGFYINYRTNFLLYRHKP